MDTAYRNQIQNYIGTVCAAAVCSDFHTLAEAAEQLIDCKMRGGTVFAVSDRGTAEPFVSALVNDCRVYGREGFRTFPLHTSSAAIELKTHARRDDVLILFCAENIEFAEQCAHIAAGVGITTIAFTGRESGGLRAVSDLVVSAAADEPLIVEDMHILWQHSLTAAVRARLSGMWGMEILSYPRVKPSAAVFNFNGVVSLLHKGWRELMTAFFIDVLSDTPHVEEQDALSSFVTNLVYAMAGQPDIEPCRRLCEEVRRRGGVEADAEVYDKEYTRRLRRHLSSRYEALENGSLSAEAFIAPGFAETARLLRESGVTLYLASAAPLEEVKREAHLLGVAEWFDGGIVGSLSELPQKDKMTLFGDSPAEIGWAAANSVYAIGVAVSETIENGIDEAKRDLLLKAGASLIIPDFSEPNSLVDFLL